MTDEHERDDDMWISTAEFLARHKGQISKPTLYRYIATGALPHIQPAGKGGKISIPKDAYERVMREQQAQKAGAR
jgi:predicted site-specific integrase-resolvase